MTAMLTTMAAVPGWPSLDALHLSGTNLDSTSLQALTQIPWMLGLQILCLISCNLTPAAIPHLQYALGDGLTGLHLGQNNLGADAIATLASIQFPNLVGLNVSSNMLDAQAAQHLSTATWPRLEILMLSYNAFDWAAAIYLAKCQWPLLQYLYLSNNKLGELGVSFLACGDWPFLTQLTVDTSAVGAVTWSRLNLDPAFLGRAQYQRGLESLASPFDVPRLTAAHESGQHQLWPALEHLSFDG